MKKVMLSAVFGAFAFTAVSAEEAVVVQDEVVAAETAGSSFDNFYFGLGLGGSFAQYEASVGGVTLKDNMNRFVGTAVFGAGKTFKDKFYFGAEALVDFSKSKTKKYNDGAQFRVRGVTPELGFRFGYVAGSNLFYGKLSAVFSKATGRYDDREIGCLNKVAPSFALGYERVLCKKFSARLEGEYVFQTKKTVKVEGVDVTLKNNRGFNVRALVTYNVKY